MIPNFLTGSPWRHFWRGVAGSTVVLLLAGVTGCGQAPSEVSVLAHQDFEITVRRSPTDERSVVEWTVRHARQNWTIRSHVPTVGSHPLASAEALTVLTNQVRFTTPYLFVREDSGIREGSRSVVDHVFRCTNSAVIRLGTISAGKNSPGGQWADGVFVDVYDRLEFSPHALRGEGPSFPIFLREQNGRFRVDKARTWQFGKARYDEELSKLRSGAISMPTGAAAGGTAPPAESFARTFRSRALFCLAFARYCERSAEFEEALRAAREKIASIDDLLDEVQTVTPGELAASRDEVLRANPALVNLFKESQDPGEAPDDEAPAVPEPGKPLLNIPPL